MEPGTLRILWYSRRARRVEKLKKEEKQVSLIKNVTHLGHFHPILGIYQYEFLSQTEKLKSPLRTRSAEYKHNPAIEFPITTEWDSNYQ